MKPFLILILSLSFTITAFAQQDSLGFTNKAEAKNLTVNGLKEGKWCESIFVNIDLDPVEEPFPAYKLTIYKGRTPFGIQRWYWADGTLEREIPYKNGSINGIYKSYFTNGILKTLDTCVNGVINGWSNNYYRSSKLKCEIFLINGKIKITKYYDENGNLIINGEIKETYETGYGSILVIKNGKLKAEYYIDKNGVKHRQRKPLKLFGKYYYF